MTGRSLRGSVVGMVDGLGVARSRWRRVEEKS